MSNISEFSFQKEAKDLLDKIKAPNSFDLFIKFRVIDHFVLFFKKKYNLKIDQDLSKKQFDQIYQDLKLITNSQLNKEQKDFISELKNSLFQI